MEETFLGACAPKMSQNVQIQKLFFVNVLGVKKYHVVNLANVKHIFVNLFGTMDKLQINVKIIEGLGLTVRSLIEKPSLYF